MDQNETANDSLVNDPAEEMPEKIVSKIYNLNAERGRSRLWKVYKRIESDTGELIEDFVACKKCSNIFKYIRGRTSNLLKHKCYILFKNQAEYTDAPVIAVVEPETKKNLERIILQWAIENCRPVDVFEDSGLQKLAEFLIATGAKYGPGVDMEDLMPQPAEILKNVTKLYADYSAKLKTELKSIRNVGYGLTTGVWSDDYLWTTYIFLTIHYIKNGELISRFLGLKSIQGNKCTSDDIKLATTEISQNFDCALDDNRVFVSERCDNMMEAFQANEHIYCMSHLLQCALEEAMDDTPAVRDICEKSIKLYNFLKNISHTFASSEDFGSPKRWNTIYHMLNSISANWDEALKISKTHKGAESDIINTLNLKHITELRKLLEQFEVTCKEMRGSSGPTLHLAIVHTHHLRKLCLRNNDDMGVVKNFTINLLNSFDKFVWTNMTLHHKIALYLFPPANKLISFSQTDKDLVRTECKRLMQSYLEIEEPDATIAYSAMQIDDKETVIDYLNELNEEADKMAPTSATTLKNSDIFRDFVEANWVVNTTEEKVNKELCSYEDTNVMLQDSFNLLQWWHLHQTEFPLLYKTSCKILAVPATAVTSEMVVTKAKPLIFEHRSAVDAYPNSVNEILFLNYNVEKNEMFYEMVIDENF